MGPRRPHGWAPQGDFWMFFFSAMRLAHSSSFIYLYKPPTHPMSSFRTSPPPPLAAINARHHDTLMGLRTNIAKSPLQPGTNCEGPPGRFANTSGLRRFRRPSMKKNQTGDIRKIRI